MTASQVPAQQQGRRPITTRRELEQAALELFEKQGFEQTTVDDIASAAGIGRRTFFRYFASKNDIPWADFEARLDRLRAWLDACPPQTPLIDAIRLAIVDFVTFTPEDEVWHRRRTRLILGVPVLRAHSTLRYAQWRMVIGEFVARRTGQDADGLIPRAIGYASLGADLAAHEQWLASGDGDLTALVDAAMRGLAGAFAGVGRPGGTGGMPASSRARR